MEKTTKKKILFLITKSDWGEPCRGHGARLAQLFCEYLEQKSARVDSICKMALAPAQSELS